MNILFFGTFDERSHPRVRVLREGFEAAGDVVDVCNVPLAFDTAARVRLMREPWRAPGFAARLAVAWIRLLLRARRRPSPEVVVVGYLGAFDVHLARRCFSHAVLVLDQMVSLGETVRDRSGGGETRSRLLRALDAIDRRAAQTADLVIVDTDHQQKLLATDVHSIVVAVGAPMEWLETTPAPDPPAGTPCRVVYFGLYTPLQGAEVIGAALARLPSDLALEVTMIGRGQDRAATEAAASATSARIRWLDWVDSEELPAVVARHHVCLGIFSANEKAARVVPNKVYQGAAAGAAIITSDTPPQRNALGAAGRLVPPGDPDALADALVEVCSDRDQLRRLRHAALDWARSSAAPAQVVHPLRSELDRMLAGRSTPPR